MESIKATYESMRSAANEVDNLAEDYEAKYQRFMTEASNLTSEHWQGIDAEEFREKVEEFRSDFANMKELMNEYAGFLRKVASQYETTQNNVRSQARSLGKHC